MDSHPVVSPGPLGTGAHTSPSQGTFGQDTNNSPGYCPGLALRPCRKGLGIFSDLSPGECGGIRSEAGPTQPDLKGRSWQARELTGSAEAWGRVSIPLGARVTPQARGRQASLLHLHVTHVTTLSLSSPPLAAAQRSLNCFQVDFKAFFCSCWALPLPSRDTELREEAQSFFPGPHCGRPRARGLASLESP